MKILNVIVLLLLTACAPYPYKGYYELDDAIATAETKEEAEYYTDKRDSFEADAVRADAFYDLKEDCQAGKATSKFGEQGMWYCYGRGMSRIRDVERRPFKDLEDKVRTYRRERAYCGCASRADVMGQFDTQRY